MKKVLLIALLLNAAGRAVSQCATDDIPPLLVPAANVSIDLKTPRCEASVAATHLLQSVSDNCTATTLLDLRLRRAGTGTGLPVALERTLALTPADLAKPVIVEIWARDLAGNTAFAYSSVSVQNPLGCTFQLLPDTLYAKTPGNNGLEDLQWTLDLSGPPPQDPVSVWTNDTYIILPENLLTDPNQQYSVQPQKDSNPLNGVTTYDLVLIQQHLLKHITDKTPFQNPYQMLAADADGNGYLSVKDIVELRGLILGIYTELPDNSSWRFVPADYVFPDPENPFLEPVPHAVTFDIHRQTPLPDFVALKVGDVNGSAIANSASAGAEDRAAKYLTIPDQHLPAGQEIEMALYASDLETLRGLQMALQFDPSRIAVSGVRSACLSDFSEENYFSPQPGALTVSWITPSPALLHSATAPPLLIFQVKALRETTLREAVTGLSGKQLRAEGYDAGGTIHPFVLRFDPLLPPARTVIQPAAPNPAGARADVALELARATWVQTEVFAADGRVLWQDKVFLSAGNHRIVLERHALGNFSGVAEYRVSADGQVARGSIVFE